MAEYLSVAAKRAATGACLSGLIVGVCAFSFAAELFDPTRPPESFGGVQDRSGAVPVSGPILQSVLISPGRKVAIISGQTLALGEKFGEAKVIEINESEVVLRSGKDLQTLKLFPEIDKKSSSSGVPPKSASSGNKGKQ